MSRFSEFSGALTAFTSALAALPTTLTEKEFLATVNSFVWIELWLQQSN